MVARVGRLWAGNKGAMGCTMMTRRRGLDNDGVFVQWVMVIGCLEVVDCGGRWWLVKVRVSRLKMGAILGYRKFTRNN